MTPRRLLAAGLIVVALVAYVVVRTPDVDHLRTTNPTQTSYMRLRGDQQSPADHVALSEVSPYLVCAVVKAEDRGFFRHAGFEWGQVRKAVSGYLVGYAKIGGSTITQQLARNLFLGPERSIHRKLREGLITRRLERALDKRRILELYLNAVEWGDGVWGAKQAARRYFDKLPAELGPLEAVFLASLLPAPRAALAGKNLARARGVQRRVLHQLLVSQLIDRQTFDAGRSWSPGQPMPAGTRELELDSVLASECGLADELAATRRARLTRSARRDP
ncbi:MAG TPA: biosynthetic peptidoglycan transglycosylase [Kofleriaceae bacterium]